MKEVLKRKVFYYLGIWSIGIARFDKFECLKSNIFFDKPVLNYQDVSDVNAMFVADPFLIQQDEKWYMFFEVYKADNNIGVIGLASSLDGYEWKYERIVLEEEFHLSYPYVFKSNDKIYMIPETGTSGYVKLYEAQEFPYKWKCIKNIISKVLWDPTVFKFNGKWWLLAWSNKPIKDSLHLYYSENLISDWKEHPKSPIVRNNAEISRPSGRVIYENGKLIRYSQDYSQYYGKLVKAFEITKLSEDTYEEVELGIIIKDSGRKGTWNKDGMHSIDVHKISENDYIAAVDGFYYKRFNKVTRKIINYIKAVRG